MLYIDEATCYFLQYPSGEKTVSLHFTEAKDRYAVNAHRATPTLSVMDPRSLAIRSVGYYRHPDKPVIEPRITRQIYDAAGRRSQSWDPRLWSAAPKPNLGTIHDLNGQPLLTDSVDAGWQLSLRDQAGSLCSFWGSRGSQRHTEYDDQQRPIMIMEQAAGERPCVVERLTYGGSDPVFAEHNQCGQLIRHDDPAGTQVVSEYGLSGAVLVEGRRFLGSLEIPDWPSEPDARDAWLEDQSFITRHTVNPTGEIQRQTDAMGNVRTFGYDVAGKLRETWLLLAGDGKQSQCLVSDIRYNAHDQIESETAGNGVVTCADYAAEDGRLIRLVAAVGSQKPLQDLNYFYDPVGNIVELEDKAQSVVHFNNQRIEPVNRYRYDSLYQLVEAKGWEVSTPSHGPALPELLPTPLDPSQQRNYTQQFDYDPAGNLITRHHSGAPGFSMFTSTRSNRSLAQRDDGSLPGESEIDSGFDACGNQRELQRGLAMDWDIRNQLSRVTLVKREGETDDYECYVYDHPGHRLRKVHFSQAGSRTLRTEVRYLPGLEVHHEANGVARHVISVEAGRCNVRALHWPEGGHDDQLRYSLSDHLGSSTLELDHQAGVLTLEHYYAFGGTACWAGRSALVAKYKIIRYSSKERDATGLYYYGYRYYASWLQRWVSADPAGPVNGLNIFLFVSNHPINLKDVDGRVYRGKNDWFEQLPSSGVILARGLDAFPLEQQTIIRAGFSEAEHIYAGAEAAMSSEIVEHTRILEDFFGPAYESVKDKVLDSFVRGKELSRGYQGAWGRDKIVGVDPVHKTHKAFVYQDDIHGRVFLNVSAIDAGIIARVFGHEITHLKDVDGVMGAGTKDYFYLNFGRSRSHSELIMQGKLPVRSIITSEERHAKVRRDFIEAVAEYDGRPASMFDIEAAGYLFNQNPGVRAKIASENADSIISAATELSHRLADSLEFHRLING